METILILNPNSNEGMTDSLRDLVKGEHTKKFRFSFLTGPKGAPVSIDNEEEAEESKKYCVKILNDDLIRRTDAFVVACYSSHPLVPWLQKHQLVQHTEKFVTGIFEASVELSLRLASKPKKFGIISTGKVWEKLLTEAVAGLPGNVSARFGGVATTGLNAKQLHDMPAEEVAKKMNAATKRLIQDHDVRAVCLGCAGMAGLDETVRKACIEELGEENGKGIHIVDGVVAGVHLAEEAFEKKGE